MWRPRIHSPTMQLLCWMLLATTILILVKLSALASGHWRLEALSLFTLGLTLFTAAGLVSLILTVSRRLNAINGTVNEIIRTGDLTQRIPAEKGSKDIRTLTGLLNHMLDEIEQLVQSARTTSDNIAHDLRHPLTRLRNRIEQMRVAPGKEACPEAQQQLADLVAECDQLLATFQAIMRISNIELSRRHGGFRKVQLGTLLQDVVELYEPLASEKNITIGMPASSSATTLGDKDLLFQAFANLIDNAIKYTPAGGQIDLSIIPRTQGACITIADNGPGIADDHKQKVFQRFYRVDPARAAPGGSGLGLSLVQAIIHLHRGQIELVDNATQGLAVRLVL